MISMRLCTNILTGLVCQTRKKNAVEKLSERYLISCEEVASVFIRCRRNVQDTEIELSKMMTDIYLKGGTIIG